MECRHCQSVELVKVGFQSGKQRYRCKACKRAFLPDAQRGYPEEIKQKALALYMEGLGFRAIGRLLGVSNVAVLKWVRQVAEVLPKPKLPAVVDILELDEAWHFVKKSVENSGCGLLLTVTPSALLTSSSVAVVSQRSSSVGND